MKRISIGGSGWFKRSVTICVSLIKRTLFGEPNRLPTEPKLGGTVVYPDHQPEFFEWCKEYHISSQLPKRIVVSKEQIADRFGYNQNELIIR